MHTPVSPPVRPEALRIALINDNPVRAAILEEGLREADHADITRLTTSPALLHDLSRLDPDMVIIDLGNPSRDLLEQMFQIGRHVPRPVAMFVDQSYASMIEAAVEAVRYRLSQRQRFGVVSTFLGERIEPGSRLRVHVQKADGFAWSPGLARPAVKVGPGTGIAPFCAFLQERAAASGQPEMAVPIPPAAQ